MQTLEEARRRLREKYLGHAGVHGLGLRRKAGAVCVYVSPGTDLGEVLEQMRREVAPHQLLVLEEAPPKAGSSDG